MAKDSLPGLAVAVVRGDSILWEEGFGWANRETRVPVTPSTPFYLASVTKTITATAAMMLRERGRLDLDRPVNAYLGAPRLWSPAWDPAGATPRRLANHTSGLTTFDLGCSPDQPRCTLPSFEEIMRRYGVLVWRPGDYFDYSNLGFKVLGEVVGKAAGQDLGTFFREEIFRPLGMTHSSLDVDPARERETAIQYAWVRGALPRGTPLASGASSVYASAHDIALFGELHTKVHRPGRRALLSDASIDTMQYSVVPTDQTSLPHYGIGWWVEDDRFGYRTVLAQGGTLSAQAWLLVVPTERIAVVVLANKGVLFCGDVIDAILATMLPRFAERRAAQKATSAGSGSAPAPIAPTQLDSTFVGGWDGVVKTVDGNLPLKLAVSDSLTVLGTVGARMDQAPGRARVLPDTMLRFNLPGDLTTADTTRRLAFYLRKRDGTLYGTVTTGLPPSSGLEARVSYWVELKKTRPAP